MDKEALGEVDGDVMYQELTTEEAEEFISKNSGLLVRLPIFEGTSCVIEKVIGFLRSLGDEAGDEAEILIFSKNSLVHSKVVKSEAPKTKTAEKLVNGLHLDYLPYTEVIISLPKNERNEEILRKLCLRFGVDF